MVARTLCQLLVQRFVPTGSVVLGIDEHLERRQGKKIAAKGIYRDAARSSKDYLTKASGRRWISLMLLAPLPWAQRIWALPFLTVLAPSERYHQERGQAHKKLTGCPLGAGAAEADAGAAVVAPSPADRRGG